MLGLQCLYLGKVKPHSSWGFAKITVFPKSILTERDCLHRSNKGSSMNVWQAQCKVIKQTPCVLMREVLPEIKAGTYRKSL